MTYEKLMQLADLLVDFAEAYPVNTNELEDCRAAVINEAAAVQKQK